MLVLGVFSTLTLAGSMYTAKRPPRPMVRDMSGFYIGLGAGASTVIAHDSSFSTQNVTGLDSSDYYPVEIVATANNMFPAAQIGYWGHSAPDVLWGLKAFYKYLDSNSETHVTGAFTENVRVPHEVALLVTVGMILRKFVPYFGIGAIWLPNVQDIYRGDSASSGYAEHRQRKSKIGAIGQLGLLYNLSSAWFLDAVYSYGFTARSLYDGATDLSNPDTTQVSRKNRVTLQEFMVSINRRF
jgi:opacity protein-like surface antigen